MGPAALQHFNANLCDLLILPFKMVSCVGESSRWFSTSAEEANLTLEELPLGACAI